MAKQITTAELVATYNEAATKLGQKTVKRFATREAAEERTRAILKQLKKAEKTKPVRSSEPIDWPFNGASHPPREDSFAGQFLALLKNGVTLEELGNIIASKDREDGRELGNIASRTRSVLRVLHVYNGYGIRQKGDVFKLVTK